MLIADQTSGYIYLNYIRFAQTGFNLNANGECVYNALQMQTRTRRQREVLDFIRRYASTHGCMPSYTLIARHLQVSSKSGVAKHLRALEDQGLLVRRWINGKSKLEVAAVQPAVESAPTIEWLRTSGSDGAGTPAFTLPAFLLGDVPVQNLAALRVTDGSMADRGISEGDIVLIERGPFSRDGSIVAALVKKKELLLRHYFRSGASVELKAAAADFEAIRLPADKVEVLGLYRGLIRPIV